MNKKQKFTGVVLAILLVATLAIALTACNKHKVSESWDYDDTYHWHNCSNCDEQHDKAEHEYGDWTVWRDSSFANEGEERATCKICGHLAIRSIDRLNFEFVPLDEGGYALVHAAPTLEGDVVIPSIYKNDSVTKIGSYAFWGCPGITSITIPDSVTGIGDDAFYVCPNIQAATMPALAIDDIPKDSLQAVTITSGSIGDSAFYNCTGLQTVTIGAGVQSIGDSAFDGCTGLQTVTIGAGVQSIGDNAFSGCTGLTKVNISSIKSWCEIEFEGSSSNPLCVGNIFYSRKSATLYVKEYGIEKEVTGDIVIPHGTAKIGNGAFYGLKGITSITIPDRVRSIGDKAFAGCTGLTSITIPDSVQSIGDFAFYCCVGLTSITIPDSVQSIGNWAFVCCVGLTSITIPGSVTSIGMEAFSGCTGLTSITIPDSVQSIGNWAFVCCVGLQEVTIGAGVRRIDDSAFDGCEKLVHIRNLSQVKISSPASISGEVLTSVDEAYKNELKKDTNGIWTYTVGETVYAIGYDGDNTHLDLSLDGSINAIYPYAFCALIDLTSITISDSVTDYAFEYCTGLQTVTIGAGVQSIGDYAFYCCAGLTSITIPDSVTSIGNEAFSGCIGLQEVTIGAGVQSIGSEAFDGCKKLVHIRNLSQVEISSPASISGEVLTSVDEAYKNELKKDTNGIWTYTVGETVYAIGYDGDNTHLDLSLDGSLNAIYPYAFYFCIGLTSITIPGSVTSIGDSAFYCCVGLTSITIPDSVTSIGDSAFEYCTGLRTVTIGAGVQSIGSEAFCGCTGLQTVNWNATNCTKAGYYFEPIFKSCTQLATVNIGKNVQTIPAYAFLGCTGLTSITIPGSVTSIGDCAFRGCIGLQEVTIGNDVTSIGVSAFCGCTSLTSITIPDSVTSIGDGAFSGCGLTSITIPDSVTSIGMYTFYGCTSLQEVTIGNGVTKIGDEAFSGCTNLNSVTFKNPNGWYYTSNSNYTGGDSISASDLQNEATAAQYLKDTYCRDYWYRKEN